MTISMLDDETLTVGSRRKRRWVVIALGTVAVALAALGVAVVLGGDQPSVRSDRGVVRVVLTTTSGTGFFVAGPDRAAYVVTAHHVVGNGEPIRIERTL